MRQSAFENDGQTRPNLLAIKFTALTAVSAFAIAGCANGEQGGNPAPNVEQISNENIDTSSLDDKLLGLFEDLDTRHDGTIAGLSSAAKTNQYLLAVYADEFNDLTVDINGRDVNCGIAENIWFVADDMPADFESDSFDPTQYERACGGFASGRELGLFLPYMGTMKAVIEEDGVLKKMQPELAAGLIQQTGQELIIADQNNETRQSIIDDLASTVEKWNGPGYVPTETEVGDIFDTAKEKVYGVTTEILPEGNAVAAPEAPTPAETTQPAIEPEFETDVSSKFGIVIDPNADYSFNSAQDIYEQTLSYDLGKAESTTYYRATDESWLTCAEYLKSENCSDAQQSALYTAAMASEALYNLAVAEGKTGLPADLQMFTIHNLLLRGNDPVLHAGGGLKTYTLDQLTTDIQQQLHRTVPKAEIKSTARETAELMGISLSER